MRLASAVAAVLAALAPSALAQPVSTTALRTFAGVSSPGFVDEWQTFTRFKGEVYFAADGGDGAGTEVWRTDGTPGGTVRVTDLVAGAGHAYPRGFTVHGGHLYFNASADGGGGLFRTDGVNPPARFAPYPVGFLHSTGIGLFGTATFAGAGVEPWFSNGTTYGMLKNVGAAGQNGTQVPSSGAFAFEERGSTVFFNANDRTSTSAQLWKTLGTEASTEKVLTLSVGAGFPANCSYQVPTGLGEFFAFGGTLHFAATWYEKTSPTGSCFTSGQDRGYLGALWTSTGSPGLPLATRALASALGTPGNRVWVDRASPRWREVSTSGPVGGVHVVAGRDELVSGEITYGGPPRLYAFDGAGFTPLFAGEYADNYQNAFARVGLVGGRLVFVRRRSGGGGFGSTVSDVMATDGTPGGTSVLGTYAGSATAGDVYGGVAYVVAGAYGAAQLYRTTGTGAPEVLTAFASATEPAVRMGAALAGGAVVFTDNGGGQGTVHFVGTPAVRVLRQPLSAPGTAAAVLSDGAGGTLGVTLGVQAITGSGAMRLELRDHASEPLEAGAPTSGVLRRYVRIERPDAISAIETSVTLAYTDADLADAGVADESTLAIWKYSGGVWTKLTVASRDLAANTITVDGIASFSDFVIADGAASLPVELASFTGVADGSTARLAWATASETNNAGFGVEQRQGTAWVERGFVAGHGTSAERHAYAFDVPNLTAGTHTFRLRQVDTDGAVHFSASITVEIRVGTGTDGDEARAARVTLLGQRAVRVETDRAQAVDVSVYDVLGRRLATAHADVSGTADVALPPGLAPGAYVVRVVGERFAETRRLVVR